MTSNPRFSLAGFCILSALLLGASPSAAKEQETISTKIADGTTTTSVLLSGTLVNRPAATTTWFLYPGACLDRVNGPAPGLGTWAARTSIVADSMNTYTTGGQGGYGVVDQSAKELLWHTTDVAHANHATQEAAVLAGNSSLWCGTYDPSWVQHVGYPNVTFQILYVDTGNHAGPWNLSFSMNTSDEPNYDFVRFIGGGNNDVDPIGNARPKFDNLLVTGSDANELLLATFTGSIQQVPNGGTYDVTAGGVNITGSDGSQPTTAAFTFNMRAGDRALYILLTSEEKISSEDGLWPFGQGCVIDNMVASDNGTIYADTGTPSGTDPVLPPGAGVPIQGSFGNQGYIAARVTAGAGTLWRIAAGSSSPTTDFCSPAKGSGSDHFFEASDSTGMTVPGSYASIVSCTFPIPPGTASVRATWNEYRDLPRGSGLVAVTEYRVFRGGAWSRWQNSAPGLSLGAGAVRGWIPGVAELVEATQADSVQLRFTIQCVPLLAAVVDCTPVQYGLFYDDLGLAVVTGVPAPSFGVYPGGLPQTTFVDGTMTGSNCASPPCWPGVRGSDLGVGRGIHDNVNSPMGDSLTLYLKSSLRSGGMGINWKQGYRKDVSNGLTISVTNGSYNAAFDQPRVIYRLFDPATKTWSPFDSTALDANDVSIAGGSVGDTTVIDGEYRFVWPPRDKVASAASLPGGFQVNGIGLYSALSFLPRGTRLQYYFKAVDINGGIAYQFSSDYLADEVEDLPTLPGGSAKAPDIIEFRVLPGVYPPGSAGSLLAGKTDTPLLNVDGAYTLWSYGLDPVVQALRGLGVRADRYRMLQVPGGGIGLGGHEIPGDPSDRPDTYFPNMLECSLLDSLERWYRIVIVSSHTRDWAVADEQDSRLLRQWWDGATGTNGGDRCIFASGDHFFNSLIDPGSGISNTYQLDMAQNVFGVADAAAPWSGTSTTLFPTIDDRFAASAAGPGLAPPATFTYPVDGGCPGVNRFDALTKVASPDAQNAVFYPNAQVAGIARMSERDTIPDSDLSKALGYAYSFQYIRQAGIASSSPNYPHSGVQNRMSVLFKYLTSCRGARSGAPGDTAQCWPCPTPSAMQMNWAVQPEYQTSTYGPLYPIQDPLAITSVEPSTAVVGAPHVNVLEQNRPNPFNPQTVVPYSLARSGKVAIRIFDVGGRLVRTLVDQVQTEGPHVVAWNGKADSGERVASGVYFYRITYPDGGVSAKKMVMLR